MDIVDEDELLYGESSLPFTSVEENQQQQKLNERWIGLQGSCYMSVVKISNNSLWQNVRFSLPDVDLNLTQ